MTGTLLKDHKVLIAAGAVIAAAATVFLTKDATIDGREVAGTVAVAERFGGETLSEDDVALGDETVSDFIQTDAFELLVNDASFRALASDPGFSALAQHPKALAAVAAAPEAMAALAGHPQALAALAAAPEAMAALAGHPQALAALAAAPKAMAMLAAHPQAMAAFANAP